MPIKNEADRPAHEGEAQRRVGSFKGHRASANSAAISPDGCTTLSRSTDNMLKLWDLTGLV